MFGTTFDSFQYTLWYLILAAIKIAPLLFYLTKFPALFQAPRPGAAPGTSGLPDQARLLEDARL